MTCEDVRTYLSAFIDRAMARNTLSEVSAHLDHCGSCDELYRGLYEADQFYSSVTTQHVPDE
jgi:predicted anti-sigma-YlaC factor YlaD